MTKTFTMTMTQMKAMFDAGRQSGESTAGAYNVGSRYNGVEQDFVEAVHEMVNENTKWGEDGYVEWDQVETMVKEANQ